MLSAFFAMGIRGPEFLPPVPYVIDFFPGGHSFRLSFASPEVLVFFGADETGGKGSLLGKSEQWAVLRQRLFFKRGREAAIHDSYANYDGSG